MYLLKRFACFISSVLIALSLVAFTVNVSMVAFLKNDNYIGTMLQKSKTEVVESLNPEFEKLSSLTGIPSEVYSGAFENGGFDIAVEEMKRDLQFGYSVNFASNTDIYNVFSNAISEYSRGNSLGFSGDVINRNASLAVDAVDEVLSASDFGENDIFNIVRSNTFNVVCIIGSILVFVACIVIIEAVNRGRHRMYNYIGMGIVSGGYILPIFVHAGDILKSLTFSGYQPYDTLIKGFASQQVKVYIAVGAILFAVGFVMLCINYNYYRKKRAAILEEKELDKIRQTEFLGDEMPKRRRRAAGEEFEKIIRKIDFEEE